MSVDRLLQDFHHDVVKYGPAVARERWIQKLGPEQAAELETQLREAMSEIAGAGLAASRCDPWYFPPKKLARRRWAHAEGVIERKVGGAIATIDRESDDIVANLCSPEADQIVTRGLVLGYVQSGKTTNFLAVAAKAADAGFHHIVVLAGIHNSLRRQTQERAEATLVDQPELWWTPTSDGDFRAPSGTPLGVLRDLGNGARGLLVVKKHKTRLKGLADWLEQAPEVEKRQLRILVIDDEADQAGLDVNSGPDLAGIHEQLMRVLRLGSQEDGHHRVAYVGYTATPFANVLTSQAYDGLYPRDFIHPLEKPAPHMGAPELFGDEVIGAPVRVAAAGDGGEEGLDADLARAIRWFVVATAARSVVEGGCSRFDSSMLIHTTSRVAPQQALQPHVEAYLGELREQFPEAEPTLRSEYEEELERVPPEGHGEDAVPWSDLVEHIPHVLGRLIRRTEAAKPYEEDGRTLHPTSGVIVDNGQEDSEERLSYVPEDRPDWEGVTVIAIGGNTLSRGLTLSGLVCSWFVRSSDTYDSLMQMARWFGYRPDYRYLIRLWTSQQLLDRFQDLTDVEEEFRDELRWMISEGKTPAEYGPRIRLLPGMNVTRSSAMKAVRRDYSFSDTVVGTIRLLLDADTIDHNVRMVTRLVEAVGDEWYEDGSNWVADAVDRQVVERLVSDYRFHPDDPRLGQGALLRWLEANEKNPLIESWTVAVHGRDTGPSELELGGAIGKVGTVIRSRIRGSDGYIKAVVDKKDVRIGASGSRSPARYRRADESPLLLLYPINARSPSDSSGRVPLDAPSDLVGLAVVIPQMPGDDYVRPALPTDDVATNRTRAAETTGPENQDG